VAKVKVVNNNLDSNLNGINFNNTASQTVFSFGSFSVTTNFDQRVPIDYSTELSTFVRPVTLETLGYSTVESEILYDYTVNAVLNLDRSDLKTFVRYGSAYEFLRTSIQDIILNYPGSLFLSTNTGVYGNSTVFDFSFDIPSNISTFKIPVGCIINKFNLIYNYLQTGATGIDEFKNLNISYGSYIVWTSTNPDDSTHEIIGYTGNTSGRPYLTVKTVGNPFSTLTGTTTGYFDFHIKPNSYVFEEFREQLDDYEKYLISQRDGVNGFKFTIKEPLLLENGDVIYTDVSLIWPTSDKYNLDIDNSTYRTFLEGMLTIGAKYDAVKTDLIARFLSPESLKTYDLTDQGKMTKLLRLYGREFDQMRQFIDSLVHINKVTYDKVNNAPDQVIRNLARTFGWDYFSLLNESELVDSLLSIDDQERNLNTDLLPAEIDIELWRRIIMNTNYYWKAKGTREGIKSMFLIIGIPEPFINITEYVYTVEGKINPNTVTLNQEDFPTNSLPYDTDGYPAAPLETNDFFFQISGSTDSGQRYLDVFRMAGFDLQQTVDNKKSWIQTGATTREHNTSPTYYQEDSRLVINTKEVDISLDTARGIEYDVYNYIKYTDFPANSSGYTLSYNYVNLSLGVSGSQSTFTLPVSIDDLQGDFEVRYNGILLNAPKSGTTTGIPTDMVGQSDYTVSGNTFTIINPAINLGNRRDVIQATYIYSGTTSTPITGISVQYMVTRVNAKLSGTVVELPSPASGDIQLTINGIALTKGNGQFNADYIVDPYDSTKIIIQNTDVIGYLAINPMVQVVYINVTGNAGVSARNEVFRIDSFSTGKLYFNNSANKYVYKLNYKLNAASEAKVLIDGIALEPGTDYSLNTNNPYEIYLPKGLKYGSVISVYYLVGGNEFFAPVIGENFGLGDISQMSFLEFLILMEQRMINATNRKTVTDSKGGWYPTLLRVYIDYLNRARLPDSNPLQSNGYTFANLYSFLSKYNTFFNRFVDQMLSATIILRKSGLLIRNSIFTKQKFTYKRGVNQDPALFYFGDDGSTFLKRPKSVDVDWTDDNVRIDDLCINLIIDNIIISYPVTTTTTTQAPYNSLITLYQSSWQQIPINSGTGIARYEVRDILFEPLIPPGYEVTLRLKFDMFLTGGTGSNSHRATAEITLNDGQFGPTINYDIPGTYTGITQIVSLVNSDSLYITFENQATAVTSDVLSKTVFTVEVVNVTPSMGDFSFVPSNSIIMEAYKTL
jgi:hypothetical protein